MPKALAVAMISVLCVVSLGSQGRQVATLRAIVDESANTISIRGQNFGTSPQVWLAAEQLVVLSATDQNIVAQLPASWSPGTYRLMVARTALRGSENAATWDAIDVTLGATGAPGPAGPAGPPGPAGTPGAP